MTPPPAKPSAPQAAAWPGPLVGLPQERLARLAARRSFVAMKRTFLCAAALLPATPEGDWLQAQIRRADAPEQLLVLRDLLFAALGPHGDHDGRIRQELERSLDSVFPDLPRPPATPAAAGAAHRPPR